MTVLNNNKISFQTNYGNMPWGRKCLHFNKLPFTFNRKGYVMIYHINETLLHNHIFMAIRCLLNDAPLFFSPGGKDFIERNLWDFSLVPVFKSF